MPDDLEGQWHDDGTQTTTGKQTATALELANVSNETGPANNLNGIYGPHRYPDQCSQLR